MSFSAWFIAGLCTAVSCLISGRVLTAPAMYNGMATSNQPCGQMSMWCLCACDPSPAAPPPALPIWARQSHKRALWTQGALFELRDLGLPTVGL